MPETLSPDKAKLAWSIPWDAGWVTAVSFLGTSRRFAAGNQLGQILLWELPEKPGGAVPTPLRRLDGHTNQVTALAASPDGHWLYSASYDHSVRIWDMQAAANGEDKITLQAKPRDGEKKGGKSSAKPVEVRVEVQTAAKALDAHAEWVRSLSLSADGTCLLTGDDRGTAILWDVPDAKEVRRLQVKGWLQVVALSPDAKIAATCEFAPSYAQFPSDTRTWDATTGAAKHALSKEFARKGEGRGSVGMAAAAFSPDAKLLAVGVGGEREDGGAKVFLVDMATGKKVRELAGHQYGVTAIVFHPDGLHVATAGRDTMIRLWQIASGKQVKELGKGRGGQFKDWIFALSFSADAHWLVAADMGAQVQVWSLV